MERRRENQRAEESNKERRNEGGRKKKEEYTSKNVRQGNQEGGRRNMVHMERERVCVCVRPPALQC